jgi:CHAT domain-containing protein
VFKITGEGATEKAFMALAPGRRVLHLATHGFFLDTSCATRSDDKRGLGGLVSRDFASTSGAGNSPLLSGLALAGANRRNQAFVDQDDGIVSAREIAGLDLSSTELAVLSACSTGVGEIEPGEGVMGLRRAFRVAGARTVIMSLWSVQDDASEEWMQRLYRGRFLEDLDTAEAVREASLGLLEERRRQGRNTHPAFWAGFVASGDWR